MPSRSRENPRIYILTSFPYTLKNESHLLYLSAERSRFTHREGASIGFLMSYLGPLAIAILLFWGQGLSRSSVVIVT